MCKNKSIKKNGIFYAMDISKYIFVWPLRIFFPAESYFTKKEFYIAARKV